MKEAESEEIVRVQCGATVRERAGVPEHRCDWMAVPGRVFCGIHYYLAIAEGDADD